LVKFTHSTNEIFSVSIFICIFQLSDGGGGEMTVEMVVVVVVKEEMMVEKEVAAARYIKIVVEIDG